MFFHLFINANSRLDLQEFNPIKVKKKELKDWRIGKLTMISLLTGSFEPNHTDTSHGSLHLYRNLDQETNHKTSENGNIICVLAVPLYMTPQDFLKLMGAQRNDLIQVRIFKDAIPNRFMILMKFKDNESASLFYDDFNGKPFNSFEPETCHTVFINSVFINDDEDIFPDDGGKKPMSRETVDNVVELPTCPVCLERMDSNITGIFTTLCQHTFHCHCIMKWADTTCPVCRYSSAKLLDTISDNTCSVCQSTNNLWICLICANVGCGRYVQAHASAHYNETNHLYSLELETQRVWDYKGDGYVHRLIQNNDGKIVQLPPPSESHTTRLALDMYDPESIICPQDLRIAEKIESMSAQYQSLSRQREQHQNDIFDQKLIKTELNSIELIDTLETRITELETLSKRLRKERDLYWQELQESNKKNEKDQEKLYKLTQRLNNAEKRANEETSLNESLRNNQIQLKNQLFQQNEQIVELQDQVNDLMFFLETRKKAEQGQVLTVTLEKRDEKKKGKKKK
jgi:BRCA1-associated protein